MSQGKPVPRVSSGVPWWVWLAGIVLTGSVILGIIGSRNTDDPDDLFAQAIVASDARDGARLMALQERLAAFPDRQDMIEVLEGVAATATNRDPRAIKLLTPHVAHSNPLVQRTAVKHCAMAYQRTGKAAEARKLYERAVELDPKDLNPHLLLARLYDAAGAYGPALEQTQAILEIRPENMEAQALKGKVHMELQEWTDAIETFSELLSTDGKRASASPDAIHRYVACLIKTEQADKALDFFNSNAALITDPSVKLGVLIASGEVSRAEDEIDHLTEGQTTVEMLTPIDAKAAMIQEDWSKAVGLLREQVRQSPRAPEAFQMLKKAAANNHESELAQSATENLAAIQDLENQLVEAIRAIGSDVEDPEKRVAVARIAARLGRQDLARQWVVAATQVAAGSELVWTNSMDSIEYKRTPLVPLPGELAGTIFDEPTDTDEPANTEAAADTDASADTDSSDVPDQPEPTLDSSDDQSDSSSADSTEGDDADSAPDGESADDSANTDSAEEADTNDKPNE